jgi:hypothetical protein
VGRVPAATISSPDLTSSPLQKRASELPVTTASMARIAIELSWNPNTIFIDTKFLVPTFSLFQVCARYSLYPLCAQSRSLIDEELFHSPYDLLSELESACANV